MATRTTKKEIVVTLPDQDPKKGTVKLMITDEDGKVPATTRKVPVTNIYVNKDALREDLGIGPDDALEIVLRKA